MKKLGIIMMACTMASFLQAHTLLMNLLNNDDNTITVHGEFSTGELASGALIKVESLISGTVLFQQRLPESSELIVAIPKEPYQVVLDGGPGHSVVKEGIAPLGGFPADVQTKVTTGGKLSRAQNGNGEWDLATVSMFSIAVLLFALTLYFSSRNTQLLLREMKTSK
jgi:hypothetical protein